MNNLLFTSVLAGAQGISSGQDLLHSLTEVSVGDPRGGGSDSGCGGCLSWWGPGPPTLALASRCLALALGTCRAGFHLLLLLVGAHCRPWGSKLLTGDSLPSDNVLDEKAPRRHDVTVTVTPFGPTCPTLLLFPQDLAHPGTHIFIMFCCIGHQWQGDSAALQLAPRWCFWLPYSDGPDAFCRRAGGGPSQDQPTPAHCLLSTGNRGYISSMPESFSSSWHLLLH